MLQAAIPSYLNAHSFSECPPGHRFNLYLEVWDHDWCVQPDAKTQAAKFACTIPKAAAELLTGLIARQRHGAQQAGEARCLVIEAETTAPFATGLGLEHPIENGFAFLSPYGLPYLAGSGVKGVLRHAAQELMEERSHGIDEAMINALFGCAAGGDATSETGPEHRGALSCWDVFPQCTDGLTVEIMTPHASTYYQGKESPHDAGQPTPIPFLAVPAGTRLNFILLLEPALLPAEQRAALADWQPVVQKIVAHAFRWLGFGAKTAVGYGAMREDPRQLQNREQETAKRKQAEAQAAEEKRRESLTPEEAELEQCLPMIASFTTLLAAEQERNKYKAGSEFDAKRLEFFKLALSWQNTQAKLEAATALRASFKFTDWPAKKERKQEFKAGLTQMDGKT